MADTYPPIVVGDEYAHSLAWPSWYALVEYNEATGIGRLRSPWGNTHWTTHARLKAMHHRPGTKGPRTPNTHTRRWP